MIEKIYSIIRPSPTFSERLRDRRERWSTPGESSPFSRLSGKLAGRSFMEENGFKVPGQIALFSNIDEMPDFSRLPERFVLKPSKGYSAQNVFVMSGGTNLLDGKTYDRNSIVEAIASSYRGQKFKGKFLIEEFLVNWDMRAGIPWDYKFYIFGDNIAFIHVIERNSGIDLKANRHWFLKEDWSQLGLRIQKSQHAQKDHLPAPDCYDELVDAVKRVGRILNMFMRVDMYATTRGAVFGEFTPMPHGGKGYTREADRWLGSLWKGKEGADSLDYRPAVAPSGLAKWLSWPSSFQR